MTALKKSFLIISLILVVAAVLFIPIPEYRQKAYCSLPANGFMAGSGCGAEGWYLGSPLFIRFRDRFFPIQQTNKPSESSISSYEDCLKSPGSILRQTYPNICVTKDGRQFEEPVGRNGDCSKVPPIDVLCAQGYHGCQAADGGCRLTCCKDN